MAKEMQGLLGLMANLLEKRVSELSPKEAAKFNKQMEMRQAYNNGERPDYMVRMRDTLLDRGRYYNKSTEKFSNQLEDGIEFGTIKGRNLRKAQKIDPNFTEGPLKTSPTVIDKFYSKRIAKGKQSPEMFVDGMNSSIHNTGNHMFPSYGDVNTYIYDGKDFRKSSISPHDGFTGLKTSHTQDVKKARKYFLKAFEDGREPPSFTEPIESPVTQLSRKISAVSKGRNTMPDEDININSFLPFGISFSALDALSRENSLGQSATTPNTSWTDRLGRNLGLGTRGVLEGLGSGLSLGLGDPGRVVSDWMGLPTAQTDAERSVMGANRFASEALGGAFGGAGLAKSAVPMVRNAGQYLKDSPFLNSTLGGLLGWFAEGR